MEDCSGSSQGTPIVPSINVIALDPSIASGIQVEAIDTPKAGEAAAARKKRKKNKRKKKTSQPEPAPSPDPTQIEDGKRLWKWFCGMPLEQRQRIITIVDAELSHQLLKMDQKVQNASLGFWFDCGELSGDDDDMLDLTSITPSAQPATRGGRGKSSNSRVPQSRRGRSASTNQRSPGFSAAPQQSKPRPGDAKGASITFFKNYFAIEYIRTSPGPAFRSWKPPLEMDLPQISREADRELHESIRLCDSKVYLDTITFTGPLVARPKRLYRLLMRASRGNFLSTPCKATWNARTGTWQPEVPFWFAGMGYCSFSTYVVSKFEVALWMRFWEHEKVDMRLNKTSQSEKVAFEHPYLSNSSAMNLVALLSKQHLVDFLRRMSASEKKSFLLSIGRIMKEVVKENLECLSYPQLLSVLLQISTPSLKNLGDIENPQNILRKANSEEEFVELLFTSPLRRANNTGLDIVMRRLGVHLQTAFSNKQSKDLIMSEEMEKSSQPSQQKHRGGSAASSRNRTRRKPSRSQQTLQTVSPAAAATNSTARLSNTSIKSSEVVQSPHTAPIDHVPENLSPATVTTTDPLSPAADTKPAITVVNTHTKQTFVRRSRVGISNEAPETTRRSSRDELLSDADKSALRHSGEKIIVRGKAKDAESVQLGSSGRHSTPSSIATARRKTPEYTRRSQVKSSTTTKEKDGSVSTQTPVNASTPKSPSKPDFPKSKSNPGIPKLSKPSEKITSPGSSSPRVHSSSAGTSPRSNAPPVRFNSGPHDSRGRQRPLSADYSSNAFAQPSNKYRSHEYPPHTGFMPRYPEAGYTRPLSYAAAAGGPQMNMSTFHYTGYNYPPPTSPFDFPPGFGFSHPYAPKIPPVNRQGRSHSPPPRLEGGSVVDMRAPKLKRRPSTPQSLYYGRQPASAPVSDDSSVDDDYEYEANDFPPISSFSSEPIPIHSRAARSADPSPHISPTQQLGGWMRSVSAQHSPTGTGGGFWPGSSRQAVSAGGSPTETPNYLITSTHAYLLPRRRINFGSQPYSQSPPVAGTYLGRVPDYLYDLSERDTEKCQCLHNLIEKWVAQTDDVMIERQKYYDPLLTRIQRIVEALWEGARIEVYGSIATKLCLPTSDVDLVIVGRLDYGVVTDLMRELEDKLSDEPWVKVDSVHAIETASIPIIKLTCTEEYCELAVDITFEHTLFHSGTASRDLVQQFVREFPDLRPLTLVLKHILHAHQLNNTFTGGLNSHCLGLMIVTFLQLYRKKQKTLGQLLLDFLELYGIKFDFEKVAMTVLQGGAHWWIGEPPPEFQPLPLHIVDPTNPHHFIGKQSFAMYKVKSVFHTAYDVLTAMDGGDGGLSKVDELGQLLDKIQSY